MQQPPPAHSESLSELPLFPLNLVLFPGMPLPLHIFEERYKAMIGSCLDQNASFGVVLIKEGQEVGLPAEPFRVGTTARIVKVETLEEGRMNILTTGERRFELVDITQQLPHLAGLVRYLPEEVGGDLATVLPEVRQGYTTFLRHLGSLAGGWSSQIRLPEDPIRLSYAVASNLDLPRDIRQKLLETATARERLEQSIPLLKRANEILQEELVKRNPFQGSRLN
jgi:Lon protease-like protein